MSTYAPFPPQQTAFTPGSWIRAIRAAHRYSRRQFAEFLAVEPEQIAKWEQKDKLPNTKGRRRTLNVYAREAGLPELAFSFDFHPREDD